MKREPDKKGDSMFTTAYLEYMTIMNNIVQDTLFVCKHNSII
jgi:hypothetical protein